MVDVYKLKGKMAERGLNTRKLAQAVDIPEQTLYAKFSSGSFGCKDAKKIINELNLTVEESYAIFFAE